MRLIALSMYVPYSMTARVTEGIGVLKIILVGGTWKYFKYDLDRKRIDGIDAG